MMIVPRVLFAALMIALLPVLVVVGMVRQIVKGKA